MPILHVKVSKERSPELTRDISEALLDLTSRILHKNRDITAITIDYVRPEDWIVGGSSLAAQGRNSFYFDVKVVDETNTKQEKAQYIRACFDAFERILGNLHSDSYIYVQDVRATAYGFGGLTQEFRHQHPG